MAGWQAKLVKSIARMETRFDRARLELKARLGTSRKPLVQPYIGHANRDALFLRGRVLLGNKVKTAAATDSAWTNFKNTYHRFESDEIPHARVRVSVNGVAEEVTCDEEGFFHVELHHEQGISGTDYWCGVQVELVETPIPGIDAGDTATQAQIIVPPPHAQFGVISDLDDTIMRTNVLNLFKMLYNTILRNAYTRLSFAGVVPFYRALHVGTTNTQNPLFYVSSSPWNLYDVILDFYRIQGIPLGPIYLRNIGITGASVGGEGHTAHKLKVIQKVLERYPELPFILIGDSGQKDAAIYTEVVRRYRGRILAVYIRDVTDEERAAYVLGLAAEVRELGVDMLLMQDTLAAAEHAAQHGYITPEALEAVRLEVQQAQHTPVTE